MYTATVIGAWGIRSKHGYDANFRQLAIDYPPSADLIEVSTIAQDASQVQPDPNVNVWKVKATLAKIQEIDADPNYNVTEYMEITNEQTS